jgi:hypothetical protein
MSFLLRLWQIRSQGELIWRASLESVHTGERKGFASLADVFTFLEQEIGQVVPGQTAPNADQEGGGDHE